MIINKADIAINIAQHVTTLLRLTSLITFNVWLNGLHQISKLIKCYTLSVDGTSPLALHYYYLTLFKDVSLMYAKRDTQLCQNAAEIVQNCFPVIRHTNNYALCRWRRSMSIAVDHIPGFRTENKGARSSA